MKPIRMVIAVAKQYSVRLIVRFTLPIDSVSFVRLGRPTAIVYAYNADCVSYRVAFAEETLDCVLPRLSVC